MKSAFLWTAVALALTLAGCSREAKVAAEDKAAPKAKGPKKGDMAPEFALTDNTGKSVKLSDFKGKVVLLNFWATWCGPCKVEIPWFIEFQQTYKDRDLVVLGVSFDDDGWKSVKPYMDEKKMNYRVMVGNDDVAGIYGGVESLPTTLMIDRTGKIAALHVGLVSKGDYKSEIEGLLDTQKGSAHGDAQASLDPAAAAGGARAN